MFGLFNSTKRFESVSAAEAKQLLKEGGWQILDVRTPNECAAGMIPKATQANVMGSGFMKKVANLDPNKKTLVYCRSGQRSRMACKTLNKNGFEKLYNLEGGYSSWR